MIKTEDSIFLITFASTLRFVVVLLPLISSIAPFIFGVGTESEQE